MRMPGMIKRLPWDGILLDILMVGLWQWALQPVSAWFIQFPHIAVWLVAFLQAMAVGRMVALYFNGASESRLLGPFAAIGGLAAVLAVGSFTWLLGVMFSSSVKWGFWTQYLPLILLFGTLISLALNLESADAERDWGVRLVDASGVILYLFLAEALLFGLLGVMDSKHTLAMLVVLLLCHLPMRLIFTLVTSKSRYDLLSATLALGVLLWSVASGT